MLQEIASVDRVTANCHPCRRLLPTGRSAPCPQRTRPKTIPLKLENLREDVRRWGWKCSLFLRIVSRLRKLAGLHLYRVGLRPLVWQERQLDGISVRIASPEELLQAASDPALDMHPDFVHSALARGDFAIGAFEGDRLVGYAWRTFTAAPDVDGLWVRVDRPCHYLYKGFTLPSHRGRHIQVAIPLFSDRYFLARGYTSEVGIVDIANFASINNGKRLGRRKVGYAGYVKWFRRCIPFRTPAVKRLGLQFFKHDPGPAQESSPAELAPVLEAVDATSAPVFRRLKNPRRRLQDDMLPLRTTGDGER